MGNEQISKQDEKKLILLIEQGDEAALTAMYRRYNRSLFIYAYGIILDRAEADDMVHDVFLKIYHKIRANEFKIHTSLSAYLYQSVHYHILNHIAKTKRSEKFFARLQARLKARLSAGEINTEQYIQKKETLKNIHESMNDLDPLTREIFELSWHHELTNQEIATKKGITVRTVQRRIKEALRVLQSRLSSWIF